MPTIDRRLFLALSAGAAMSSTTTAAASTPAATGLPTGQGPGDFDFLTGEWTIALKNFDTSGPGADEVRAASATVHRVLNGCGSIEELRRADGSMWGMGVRVWHPEESKWADHWTAAENGVVNPPQLGSFIDGAGVFRGEETADGITTHYRAIWDRITPTSCRWHQASSRDGGETWEYSWYMEWTRVG